MQIRIQRSREAVPSATRGITHVTYRATLFVTLTADEQRHTEQHGMQSLLQILETYHGGGSRFAYQELIGQNGLVIADWNMLVVETRVDALRSALDFLVLRYWPAAILFDGDETIDVSMPIT